MKKELLKVNELEVGKYYEEVLSGRRINVLVLRRDSSGEVLCRYYNLISGLYEDFFAADYQLREW